MAETRSTDVLVIGAGPGGYTAAIRAAQLGKKVLCVDKAHLGGVCLNVGCIPSKALIHAAKQVKQIRDADQMGITVGDVKVDLGKMQEWKGGVVNSLTGGIGQLFKLNGVEHLKGTAKLTGKKKATVEIRPDSAPGGAEPGEAETIEVTFDRCIVATGGRPVEIPGFAFDHDVVIDSTDALELTKLPDELVVIGGGYIGLELTGVYANLGSKVTVVEMMDQMLPGQDPDLVRVVTRHLKQKGVTLHNNARAKGYEMKDGRAEVTIEVNGKEEKLTADKILVAVGRRANVKGIGLEDVGVEFTDKGLVKINERCETSIPSILAIGDIVPGPALAHKASKEATVAAAVAAGKDDALDYRALPWAVFTEPEIASVGLTEEQAKEKGLKVKVGKFPFAASGRAKSTNEDDGWVKMITDVETDILVGVHIVGPEASNLIAEAALAIEMGATAEDLALTVHTHPTLPESLMEAAEAVHGQAIHVVNR